MLVGCKLKISHPLHSMLHLASHRVGTATVHSDHRISVSKSKFVGSPPAPRPLCDKGCDLSESAATSDSLYRGA